MRKRIVRHLLYVLSYYAKFDDESFGMARVSACTFMEIEV